MLALIKSRAGSKMAREADRMITYDHVYELFCANKLEEACQQLERHAEIYLEYQPKSFITLKEIDFDQLESLHPVYINVLLSLTCNDPEVARLNDRVRELTPFIDLDNKDVFEYAYTDWFHRNEPTINHMENWALGVPEEGYSFSERERYERAQEVARKWREKKQMDELAFEHQLFMKELNGLGAAMKSSAAKY